MTRVWLLAASLIVCGCVAPRAADLCLDSTFSEEQTTQFQTAIDRWTALSEGATGDVRISCESRGVNVRLLSVDDPAVVSADAYFKSQVIALTNHNARWMWIVPSRAGSNFRQTVQHELGHWNGLAWPNCDQSKRDCLHVPESEGPAIMTPSESGVQEFTEADRLFCIASGVCPL